MLQKKLLFIAYLIKICLSTGSITIQSTQPHNRNCYTQGLFFLNDTHLFESCGLYGKSYFHILQYQASPFELRESYSTVIPWKSNIFLEGAILFKGFLYLLTWREKIVYKLNSNNFQQVQQYSWNKDGWGLTTNGTHMFTTDGSQFIYLVDQNFTIISQKQIKGYQSGYQKNINELEFVNGYIYANIYLESKIVKIDFENAQVIFQYDGYNLVSMQNGLRSDQVINGIAYDKNINKFLLTGKDWSKIYQVKLTQSEARILAFLFFLSVVLFSL